MRFVSEPFCSEREANNIGQHNYFFLYDLACYCQQHEIRQKFNFSSAELSTLEANTINEVGLLKPCNSTQFGALNAKVVIITTPQFPRSRFILRS
jgi:hypothetical protein